MPLFDDGPSRRPTVLPTADFFARATGLTFTKDSVAGHYQRVAGRRGPAAARHPTRLIATTAHEICHAEVRLRWDGLLSPGEFGTARTITSAGWAVLAQPPQSPKTASVRGGDARNRLREVRSAGAGFPVDRT